MDVLAWLAFPMIATALAMCWAAWRGRNRTPRRTNSFGAVDDFRRFTDAAIMPPAGRMPPADRRGRARRGS